MDNSSCCARTRKLRVFAEDIEPILLSECSVGKELSSKSNDVRMALLSRWAILQDSGGTLKHDESIGSPMPARLCAFNATEERAAGLLLCTRLCNWNKNIRTENR